ncbi:hypothetical protein [Spirillospora sp. NPDC048823]|uniref:hypothetical protein n=1 Tax=unclassified Spirillospora TaxID=2642701 RepID=UPI00371EFECC
MATDIRCPPMGMMRPAGRLKALRERPDVAVTINTDTQPPEVLLLRGRISITEVDGMVPEQARSASSAPGEAGNASSRTGLSRRRERAVSRRKLRHWTMD